MQNFPFNNQLVTSTYFYKQCLHTLAISCINFVRFSPNINNQHNFQIIKTTYLYSCHERRYGILTSGAKYSGVPQNVFVVAPCETSSLQSPKSAILI